MLPPDRFSPATHAFRPKTKQNLTSKSSEFPQNGTRYSRHPHECDTKLRGSPAHDSNALAYSSHRLIEIIGRDAHGVGDREDGRKTICGVTAVARGHHRLQCISPTAAHHPGDPHIVIRS